MQGRKAVDRRLRLARAGDDRPRQPRGAVEQVVAVAQHRAEQLPHRPERMLDLELQPPGAQHAQPQRGRVTGGDVEQSGLAEPGCALDDDGAADATGRGPQHRVDELQLRLALE